MILRLDDISLAYGEKTLFNNLSCSIQMHHKIGLVGDNGSGKTTLLKVIAGTHYLDHGTVQIPLSTRIAYMPQEIILASQRAIWHEAVMAYPDIAPVLDEYVMLDECIALETATTADFERYADLSHTLQEADYPAKRAHASKILTGLGFTDQMLSVETLSVGWKMRLVLAKLLLQEADFYLFDEPTNHLDLAAKDWLMPFLEHAPFGFLLVSHDAYVLDTVCDHIMELDRGDLTTYTGNYTKYKSQKEAATERLEREYLEQQRYIAQQTATIERFRASASKAKMAQSMLKNLEKLPRMKPPASTRRAMHLPLQVMTQPGKEVLTVRNLTFAFATKKICTNASFTIMRGHKVALVAPNGVGKTTVLHVIMGKLMQQQGNIEFGHNVVSALFEQDQTTSLHQQETILDEALSYCKTSEERSHVRALLGAFLFTGDDVHKKIEVLSGGEKNRVAMVTVLLRRANFLILDEPTNHLDILSKEILLKVLQQYPGTILFVSHDRHFLNALATDILELHDQTTHLYAGNYDSYLAQKAVAEAITEKVASAMQQTQVQSTKQALPKADRKKLQHLEASIDKLEKRRAVIINQFTDLAYGTQQYHDAVANLKVLDAELASLQMLWEGYMQQEI